MDNQILKGRRILVVEDEMMLVVVIEDVLIDLGIQIIGPAAHLDEAVLLARQTLIDGAILDINIEGGNSYPVADIMVERSIPFIFCTGYNPWAIVERHRARPCLIKPFNALQLKERVMRLVGVIL